jgi:hypothetical protein
MKRDSPAKETVLIAPTGLGRNILWPSIRSNRSQLFPEIELARLSESRIVASQRVGDRMFAEI